MIVEAITIDEYRKEQRKAAMGITTETRTTSALRRLVDALRNGEPTEALLADAERVLRDRT